MADQIRTRGSTRIKKADPAGVKYRGSATGSQFDPVKAASTQTKHKQRKSQLVQDIEVESRELSRAQTAANLELKGRQTVDTSELKSLQLQESSALKLDQTQEAGQFNIDKTVELLNASLNVAGVSAQGQVASANFKAISQVAQLSLKFAQTWHTTLSDEAKAREAGSSRFLAPAMEGPDGQPLPGVEEGKKSDKDFTASLAANQQAADKVAPNEVVRFELTKDASDALRTKQARRLSINEAANTVDPYLRNFMASDKVIENTPWGPLAPNQASGAQIQWMAQLGLHMWGIENNVGLMIEKDPQQVQAVLLPKANGIYQQLLSGLGQQDIANQIKAKKLEAEEFAAAELDSGKNAATVNQELRASLIASGGYRGNPGGASNDSEKFVLDHAVKTRNEKIIDQLEASTRIEGNKGLSYKKILAADILDARRRLDKGLLDDANDVLRDNRIKTKEILVDYRKRIFDAKTNEEEVAINKETIKKLESLGSDEANKKALEMRNAGLNYNPYLYSRLVEQQTAPEDPRVFTNDELFELVYNKDITKQEAINLGYDATKGKSADEAAQAKLKDWKIDTAGAAKGLVWSIFDKVGDDNLRDELVKTQGSNMANDLTRRLNQDMYTWLRQNPTATPSEAGDHLDKLIVLYNTKTLSGVRYNSETGMVENYTFGGESPRIHVKTTVPSYPEVRDDGTRYFNYSRLSPEQLTDLGSKANAANTQILTLEEIEASYEALSSGNKEVPRIVSEKAEALGISITALLELQGKFTGKPEFANPPMPGYI